MIIPFQNRQSRYDPAFYRNMAQRLFDAAENSLEPVSLLIKQLPADGLASLAVSVVLAGPIVMRRINREQRQVDQTTDILSFPMLDLKDGRLKSPIRDYDLEIQPDGSRILLLGDLFLSPDKANRQAAEYGHSIERESAFLLVHGLLHLLGYDHKTKRQEAVMNQLAEDFLATQKLTR